ncbi:Hpt domain-containing protein [Caulobacter segnis]|uniref:Hpt domain-containing protein n=1 Tax=Caulobacter segnis TaxID=88688 RepID=A0A2W5WSJ3_9CAUL|nr:Hpt domain-containing protein [Caulobacter segnis]PZR37118.1 MAG: Hpt domain-containing protein [Caulobacter segnis]
MARRDNSEVMDFAYLEGFAAGDFAVVDEVLALFRQQAALWAPRLDSGHPGWRDAVHTVKGAARGVGAFALGEVCDRCEAGQADLEAVRDALEAALADIAAYVEDRAARS